MSGERLWVHENLQCPNCDEYKVYSSVGASGYSDFKCVNCGWKMFDIEYREYEIIPIDDLKNRILVYAREHGTFWPDELADKLNVDPFKVVEVCEELVKEGRLRYTDSDDS